ncbi:serine hydrolase [Puniceibacterium sp. IMCC21224]|uniref:serine hydrolase n=1 Tax=Puniceibacterium sp. IMCC21224 TaxID=1618204 RepID=UPI0018CCEF38|nr:serine hydrolase [Puniceibacterium sp. IMCC21224]
MLDIAHESTVGAYGFYGSTAAIQFGDGTRWTDATGVTGPTSASQGGRALVVDDRFHIGSQTKTYTGTVVLQFVDDGVVSLDDTLQHWYELQPDATSALSVMSQSLRETLTIHDLLSMRTGVAEYLAGPDPIHPGQTVLDVWNANDGDYDLTRQELLTASLAQAPTMTPGDQNTFEYSNANFMLAGIIAEAASCQAGNCRDIGTLITDEVITPLNLTNTLYPIGIEWGTDQHTNGTWDQYGTLSDFTDTTPSVPNSAGAMISNIEDQLNWLVEVSTNAQGTLDPAVFAERLVNTTDMNGMIGTIKGGYGLGIYGQHSTETGAFMLGHGGELSGYQTLMFHYPGDTTTPLDDLFIVSDLNTFLNLPSDRDFLPSDINSVYYDLQKTVFLYNAYQDNPGGCTSDATGTTCTATTVADTTMTVSDAFTIQPSGQRWIETDVGFDAAVPTYVYYGNNGVGVTATDTTITVEADGIIEGYGNELTLLQLGGNSNTVDVFGEVEATGASAVAIDASSSSDDTINVAATGNIAGDILATGGSDAVHINGAVLGDISLGSAARLDGVGMVMGMVDGTGTTAPGMPGGTTASSMTVSRFEPTGGMLEINVFGNAGTANILLVDEQKSEGFAVSHTGIAVLDNSTLRLTGTPLSGDIQTPILTAVNGLTGTFSQIDDTAGVLDASSGRLQYNLVYTTNSVLLTSTSPAAFDAVAAGSYNDSLSVLDQALSQSEGMARNTPSRPFGFARGLGSFASYDKEDGVAGFDIGTSGLMGGIGGPLGSGGYYALSVAQTQSSASVSDGGATQDIDNLSAGFSVGFGVGALDVSASVFYGKADVDYSRETGAGTAHGSTDQQRWSAIVGVGQTIEHGNWRPSWRSSLAYFHVSEDAFTESASSGVAMSFDERSYERLRLGLGVKAERQPRDLTLSPWVSADVFYHADTDSSDIRYRTAGTSGSLKARSAEGIELRVGAGASYTAGSGAIWSAGITASGGDLATTVRLDARLGLDF